MSIAKKFAKFGSVGIFATLFQYILLILFVEQLELDKVYASIYSFSISAVSNYWLNYTFTFESTKKHISTAPKFLLIVIIGLILNTLVFKFSLITLGFNYLVAQIIATAFVFIWNFLANHYWTFGKVKNHE